jgi:adenosylcobinamide-GDP ribazoletransferase
MVSSLILAVRFLTVVPVAGREADAREALGRAAWWFPVVGLAMGIVLVAADRALQAVVPPMLAAVLVLTIWKAATGAIHLDGLADCLDGLAGHDRVQRLAIMQDSRVGVFGAVGLTLYLLIAFVGLSETPTAARGRLLLVAPVFGRLVPLLIAPRFRPAKPNDGSGAAFLRALSPWAGLVHLAAVAVFSAWLLGPWGPAMMLASLLVALLWTAFLADRFGGITGDVLGSVIELSELAILLEGASLAHSGAI